MPFDTFDAALTSIWPRVH